MNLDDAVRAGAHGAAVPVLPGTNPLEQALVTEYESAPGAVRNRMLAQLVGQVYENAPLPVRGQLLDRLLRPIGVLGLATVAGGIFAGIRFRSRWLGAPPRIEDVEQVRTSDVLALVDRAQEAGADALHGLANVITASPVLAGSTAASLLLVVLLRSARSRQPDDFDA